MPVEETEPSRVLSFKTLNPVQAPFTSSGRSSFLLVEDKHQMIAWTSHLGIFYRFINREVAMLVPWSNVIEVTFAKQ